MEALKINKDWPDPDICPDCGAYLDHGEQCTDCYRNPFNGFDKEEGKATHLLAEKNLCPVCHHQEALVTQARKHLLIRCSFCKSMLYLNTDEIQKEALVHA